MYWKTGGIRLWACCVMVVSALAGCAGDDGEDGEPGALTGVLSAETAASLQITIDEVSVESPPVVTFTATDGNGVKLVGLSMSNLRFNIAKLVPGTQGGPSDWQDYINRLVDGDLADDVLQGTTESDGVLEDLGNGQYTYTFATDITDPAATVGDIAYDPSLTHRVAMQISGFPPTNPTFDFRPDGGALSSREIVETATCNNCHNELAIHGGGRIEIKYCVTCHNPGSADPDTLNTVDFKVMIHKIHRGEDLPSVAFGPDLIDDGGGNDDGTGVYRIIGFRDSVHDYSNVVFPQDIRNCTNCHDEGNPATPQGGNWKTRPSIEACGSCHDNIDFSKDGSAAGDDDPLGHSGGVVTDNSECLTCHAAGRIAGSIENSHKIPGKAEAADYELKIDSVTGGATPAIALSVINPADDQPYDLTTGTVFTGSNSSLRLQVGWSVFDSGENADFNNVSTTPTTGESYTEAGAPTPAQPIRFDFIDDGVMVACDGITVVDGDWICSAAANVYTITKQSALPAGAVGTGRVALEGHLALPDDSDDMPIRSAIKDFVISGTLAPRRDIVDIDKCNQCHEQLSLHGSNRTDEIGLCVMCHNPSLTDISYQSDFNSGPFDGTRARPKVLDGASDVLYAEPSPLDGKTEETADFKAMIHAIHAGDADEHGFRRNGIQLRRDDFSHVRFPGILQDCETCHLPGTYELGGSWETPTLSGLQATAIATTPAADDTNADPVVYGDSLNDSTDDLRVSPTAAACSGCHDSQLARSHMELLGGAVFGQTQDYITSMTDGNFESCAVCHGPGKLADVAEVHARD